MLTENDVVEAVAEYLKDQGWQITDMSQTDQRGHDILARRGGIALAVEAKGGTSSKRGTHRHGLPFNSGQKRSHVFVALYKAACVFSAGHYRPGIALPSDDRHCQLIEDILPALEALRVAVFLVSENRTVHELQISN